MRLLIFALVLLATALRFSGLGDKSLWGDEIAQAIWSSWDWVKLWQEFRSPPDFIWHFVLVHLAQLLGREEFWTRFPSAVTSLVAVPLTYVVARRMTDRITGIVAMALVAVAPYQIWYAQEARMYAALGCYALIGLYFFVRLTASAGPVPRRGTSESMWRLFTRNRNLILGLVIGNTLAIYTHLFGVFPLLAQAAAAVGLLALRWLRDGRVTLPQWAIPLAIGFGLSVVLALPLLPGTIPYALQGAEPAVSAEILPSSPFQLTGGFGWELLGDIGMGARENWRTALSLGLAGIGLVFLAVSRPRSGWIAGVWLALPLLVLAWAQPRHTVSARYLIFLQPVYLLLIACAVVSPARALLDRFRQSTGSDPERRSRFAAIALVVGGIVLLGIVVVPPLLELYPRAKLNDWRALARYIEQHGRAGDFVLGERNTPNMNALTYYLPNLLRYTTPPTSPQIMEDARSENRRIWYISAGEFFDPEGEAWARANLGVVPLADWLEPNLQYAPESAFEFTQSEHLATLYFRDGLLPAEINYVGRQGFSNENTDRLKMEPGETLDTELRSTVGGEAELELEFSSKKAAQFDVLVNERLVGQVREHEADKGTQIIRWRLPGEDASARVRITNVSKEFPLFIKQIALKPLQ